MAAQCDTRPPILMTTLEGEGCSDAARDFARACIKGLGLGFRVQVSGFGVQCAGFRVQGLGMGVCGSGPLISGKLQYIGAWGLVFRV